MEGPILLVMGVFVSLLVFAGILYSIYELKKMRDNPEEDKDME